jgi:hypothetical protein
MTKYVASPIPPNIKMVGYPWRDFMTYISREKAAGIIRQCLDELYRNSKPSITWAEVNKQYGGKKTQWWRNHRIKESVYEEISERYRKRLSPLYRDNFHWLLLQYAPMFEDEVRKKDG